MTTNSLNHLDGYINVDDLVKRCMGNLDFATRILGMLNDRCEADLGELEAALSDYDPQKIAKISHRLKGALANSGAYNLCQQAAKVCENAPTSTREEIADQVTQLRREWNNLAALINEPDSPAPRV